MPQPPTFKPLHPPPTFHLLCDNHTILPPGTTTSTPPRDLFTHETPLLHITQLKTLQGNKLRRVNISVRLYHKTSVTSPPSTTIPPLENQAKKKWSLLILNPKRRPATCEGLLGAGQLHSSAALWGFFLAVSSNTQYQIINELEAGAVETVVGDAG
ncbi:hypothetical protein KIW84_065808 [Lathyrus oleraceus]|uniref:Uncharacterized protein n=1 Tax=Pisum sativum TaxID=3888 RepID=A0A9D5ACZ1_PEA|nr:hypothetical protein KIW84_065808 [Pisum sativum]